MTKSPSNEKCCCCIHVHNASCAIAVIQLISAFIWSSICFMILYTSRNYIHLPPDITDFIREEYGSTLSQHYIMWTILISMFLSSTFVIIGHSRQNGRWYWPSLIVNTLVIGRYVESQIVYIINNRDISNYFWVYFTLIIIDIYFTLMLYKGKSYLDWLRMELTQAKQLDDLMVAIHEVDGQHLTRPQHATAPPMSENDYYVLH